jgi:L-cysteine/cystine lyase
VAHVDNLRRHFPAVRQVTYLDTARRGIVPDASLAAMKNVLGQQLEDGQTYLNGWDHEREVKQQIRDLLARLLATDSDSIALFTNVGQAMHAWMLGYPFAPTDEVVWIPGLSDDALIPILAFKQTRNALIRRYHPPREDVPLAEGLRKSVTERTRFIVCPHVSAETGQRYDLGPIAEVARDIGAFLIVDGSNAVGCEPVSLANAGIDMYWVSGHQWLYAPMDTGAAYFSKRLLEVMQPVLVNHTGLVDTNAFDPLGSFLLHPNARRFDAASANLVNWTGFYESLRFLRVTVGWDYAFARIEGLTGYLYDALLDTPSVQLKTPREARSGSLVFTLNDGLDCQRLVREAVARDIVIHAVNSNRAIRVSLGVYNSEDEIHRFVQILRSFVKQT